MASVLVTGGTGHLGRDLVRRLLSDGHRVRVLSRSPQTGGGVEWVLGDLATGAGLTEALQGVNTLIHAATCAPVARRGPSTSSRRQRTSTLTARGAFLRFPKTRAWSTSPCVRRRSGGCLVALCAGQARRGATRSILGSVVVGGARNALLLPSEAHTERAQVASAMARAESRIQSGRYVRRGKLSGEVRLRWKPGSQGRDRRPRRFDLRRICPPVPGSPWIEACAHSRAHVGQDGARHGPLRHQRRARLRFVGVVAEEPPRVRQALPN